MVGAFPARAAANGRGQRANAVSSRLGGGPSSTRRTLGLHIAPNVRLDRHGARPASLDAAVRERDALRAAPRTGRENSGAGLQLTRVALVLALEHAHQVRRQLL